MPRWLEREGLVYQGAEPIYCNDLAERKHLMFEETDAVLCYPGGFGHLGRTVRLAGPPCRRAPTPVCPPIYLYNWEKYYAPLMLQMETAVEAGLLQPQVFARVHSFETADALEESLAKEYPKGGAKVRDSEGGLPERSRRPAVAD